MLWVVRTYLKWGLFALGVAGAASALTGTGGAGPVSPEAIAEGQAGMTSMLCKSRGLSAAACDCLSKEIAKRDPVQLAALLGASPDDPAAQSLGQELGRACGAALSAP